MASLCKNLRLARHGASYITHRLGAMRLLSASSFCSNRPILTPPKPKLGVNSQSTVRLAPRAFHNIAPTSTETGDGEPQLVTEIKKAPPAHYLVEIDSFSMLDKLEINEYETGEFQAGGYKWKLKIYPNGLGNEEDGDNVSVKLVLADTSALPENWEVDAVFSICLLNQHTGYYHSVLGRTSFNAKKTEWCNLKFLPQQHLINPVLGYLINDKCVFGAEVFVNENNAVTEKVSLKNLKFPPYKKEFEISSFPVLRDGWVSHQTWTSKIFSAGGREWKLKVCPNGWEEATGRLSIFLEHVAPDDSSDDDSSNDDSSDDDSSDDEPLADVRATYTITLKNQYGKERDVKYTCSGRYSASGGDNWGWRSFIDLATLYDSDKGFISYDDCVRLELELSVEAIQKNNT